MIDQNKKELLSKLPLNKVVCDAINNNQIYPVFGIDKNRDKDIHIVRTKDNMKALSLSKKSDKLVTDEKISNLRRTNGFIFGNSDRSVSRQREEWLRNRNEEINERLEIKDR